MQGKPPHPRAALSIRQSAVELGVHPATLARWILAGEGPRCIRKVHGSGRVTVRIPRVALDAYLQELSQVHT